MRVQVRVPCSTSNLGAGFDCIGLALDRHLLATLEAADTPLNLQRTGTLASLADAQDDLVVAAMRTAGAEPRGTLTVHSDIPVGRGLGSSAAATVAGLMLAARLNHDVSNLQTLAARAADIEGHPDNAVPAVFGGLVAALSGPRVRALRLSEQIRFVYAAPQALVATHAARRALPERVSHAAAARSVARAVALVEGLADADADLLRIGFNDELHVPYRLSMIPGGESVLQAATDAGAWAATISGSGSGMIAVCERAAEDPVLRAMQRAFEAATAAPAIAFITEPDRHGAQYID